MTEPEDLPSPERGQALRAMKYRDFRWYWLSGLCMSACQGIEQLALAWLVLDLTGSVGQLGLVVFMQGVPMSVVALFGGLLADRYNRRNLLMASQIVTALSLAGLAALTIADVIAIWHVYLFSIFLGGVQSITMPGRSALVQSLVPREDLANAIALNAVQQQSSTIFWPTLAGGVIAFIGVGTTISISAAVALLGAVCLIVIRVVDDGTRPERRSVTTDLVEGARYVRATPRIRELLLLSFSVGAFGVAFHSLAPGFAREVMDMSAGEAGIFLASRGIGAIVASVVMVSIDGGNRMRRLGFGFAIWALSMFLVAANPLYITAIVLMIFHGAALSALTIAGQTLFQTQVPQALLGRVISLWSLATGVGFVVTLPVGILGDELGLRWTLLAFSGVLTLFAIVIGLRPAASDARGVQPEAAVQTQAGSATGS